MKTLVEIIKEFNDNIKELEAENKRIEKAFKELEEERQNVVANIAMYKNIVEQLNATKNKEISKAMQETAPEVPAEEKKGHSTVRKTVYAIDENGNIIAEFNSINEAARDLKISYATVYKMVSGKTSANTQLKKHGYYLECK